VSSGDLDHALRIASRIRAGSVSVNGGMCIAGDLPFGGYKMSGVGRNGVLRESRNTWKPRFSPGVSLNEPESGRQGRGVTVATANIGRATALDFAAEGAKGGSLLTR